MEEIPGHHQRTIDMINQIMSHEQVEVCVHDTYENNDTMENDSP